MEDKGSKAFDEGYRDAYYGKDKEEGYEGEDREAYSRGQSLFFEEYMRDLQWQEE